MEIDEFMAYMLALVSMLLCVLIILFMVMYHHDNVTKIDQTFPITTIENNVTTIEIRNIQSGISEDAVDYANVIIDKVSEQVTG